MPTLTRPADCTCHGFHTDGADRDVTNATLVAIRDMETCPAERRALDRIINSPR